MTVDARHLRRPLAVAATALALGLSGVVPAQAAQTTNTDPGSLVVYSNNIENQPKPECGEDWNKLFTYIKSQPKSPDLFIVQQISDQTSLNALTTRMTDELPGTYAGVIAIPKPVALSNYTNDDAHQCKNGVEPKDPWYKATQTNAVIYRSDRLTPTGAEIRWRSDAPTNKATSTTSCRNLDKDNGGQYQDRVENVAVRLTDTLAHKDVTVASFHWPTSDPWNGPYCAVENMNEAQDRTAELGGALTVLGGDANAEYVANIDAKDKNWWANGYKAGFRDPFCAAAPCAKGPATSGSRRIDYVLVKGGHGFANPLTVTDTVAGGSYSDHFALRADVKY